MSDSYYHFMYAFGLMFVGFNMVKRISLISYKFFDVASLRQTQKNILYSVHYSSYIIQYFFSYLNFVL